MTRRLADVVSNAQDTRRLHRDAWMRTNGTQKRTCGSWLLVGRTWGKFVLIATVIPNKPIVL